MFNRDLCTARYLRLMHGRSYNVTEITLCKKDRHCLSPKYNGVFLYVYSIATGTGGTELECE